MICKNLNKWSSIVLTLALAASMCFVLPAQKAYAATKTSVAAGGNWNAAATWLPNGVPAAADDPALLLLTRPYLKQRGR
jgi:hypothetical protein